MNDSEVTQEESSEEIGDLQGDRELSQEEDIELDIRESMQEIEQPGEEESPSEVEQPAEEQVQQSTEQQPTKLFNPPARLSAEHKERFNALETADKEWISQSLTNAEAKMHEATQEAAQLKKDSEDITHALASVENDWAMRGITRGQAVRQLVAAQQMLETDFLGAMKKLAEQKGSSLRELADAIDAGGNANAQQPQSAQVTQQPQLREITQTLQYLVNEVQSGKQATVQAAQQAELAELHSVRDETNSAGRYLRPELHDEAFVTAQVGPLYQALKQQSPGEKPSELMKRAYTALTGKAPQSAQVLPTQTQSPNASRASLSVRGKPLGSPKPLDEEVPDSVEDTIRQAAREHGLL